MSHFQSHLTARTVEKCRAAACALHVRAALYHGTQAVPHRTKPYSADSRSSIHGESRRSDPTPPYSSRQAYARPKAQCITGADNGQKCVPQRRFHILEFAAQRSAHDGALRQRLSLILQTPLPFPPTPNPNPNVLEPTRASGRPENAAAEVLCTRGIHVGRDIVSCMAVYNPDAVRARGCCEPRRARRGGYSRPRERGAWSASTACCGQPCRPPLRSTRRSSC